MPRTFAFLYEPASYTVDRNREVYTSMGVDFCYLHGKSEAQSVGNDEQVPCMEGWSIWKKAKYIRHILKNYDTIIFNGYVGQEFRLYYLLNLFYRRPTGLDSDTQYSEPTSRLKRWAKRLYLKGVFGNRHYYGLAGGNYSHKDLFRKFGMPEHRIFLMPMMVDNTRFDDAKFRIKASAPFRFIYVGRLVEVKNVEIAVQAFIEYQKSNPSAEFHIVGRGQLEDSLNEKYESNPNIIFEGPKFGKDLIESYKRNNVLILPSTYEPWGLVVNEAMSAGLPVIVSDAVGARYDLVDGQDTGYVVNTNDIDQLVDAMQKISEESTYRRMSENAHSLMQNRWNYDLYRQCLDDFINATQK